MVAKVTQATVARRRNLRYQDPAAWLCHREEWITVGLPAVVTHLRPVRRRQFAVDTAAVGMWHGAGHQLQLRFRDRSTPRWVPALSVG